MASETMLGEAPKSSFHPKLVPPTLHCLSFTGRCTNRTGNLGVLCDYGEEAICYPNTFKKKVTENVLPPSSKYCEVCARVIHTGAESSGLLDCNIAPKEMDGDGDCIQRTQIVVTGILNVTGIPTPRENASHHGRRSHFYVKRRASCD